MSKSFKTFFNESADAMAATQSFSPPSKTKVAYKLFRTLKTQPGKIFPLFIGKSKPTPIGKWIPAEFLPTKGFAARPGWHVGAKPIAKHLMKKDGTMPTDRVWAEVRIPADVDWQKQANLTKTRDLPGTVPVGGFYRFKRPARQGGEWWIAGALKVVRILSDEEVKKLAK